MSELLTSEEMMLVGGGCSRGLSRAVREYNKNKNKTKNHREKRCSER